VLDETFESTTAFIKATQIKRWMWCSKPY